MTVQIEPEHIVTPEARKQEARHRVTILVNVVAPYRVPLYRALARAFRLTLLYVGGEDNRAAWEGYANRVGAAEVRRSRGLVLRRHRRGPSGGVVDTTYLSVTPGYASDLVHSRPDAIVTIEMGFRSLVALTYGRLARTPVWVWWGGNVHTERGIGAARRLVRKGLARAVRRWISYGETSTEYLLSLGIPRERILQIQNSIDEQYFAASTPPRLTYPRRPVVMTVGRLVGRKGFEQLLEVAAALQREGKQFTLVLVGDGPERRNLEQRIAELALRDTHIVSEIRPDDMPGVYRSADLVVFPSLVEVWGLVVNEALWSGVPVLASRFAGCAAELLPPDQLFDPTDPKEFAAVLRRALEHGLPTPDMARLRTADEVGQMIVDDIARVLDGRSSARRHHAR